MGGGLRGEEGLARSALLRAGHGPLGAAASGQRRGRPAGPGCGVALAGAAGRDPVSCGGDWTSNSTRPRAGSCLGSQQLLERSALGEEPGGGDRGRTGASGTRGH